MALLRKKRYAIAFPNYSFLFELLWPLLDSQEALSFIRSCTTFYNKYLEIVYSICRFHHSSMKMDAHIDFCKDIQQTTIGQRLTKKYNGNIRWNISTISFDFWNVKRSSLYISNDYIARNWVVWGTNIPRELEDKKQHPIGYSIDKLSCLCLWNQNLEQSFQGHCKQKQTYVLNWLKQINKNIKILYIMGQDADILGQITWPSLESLFIMYPIALQWNKNSAPLLKEIHCKSRESTLQIMKSLYPQVTFRVYSQSLDIYHTFQELL